MNDPRPTPHVRIPAALFDALPDPHALGCACDLYRFADRQRYEPFEATDSWLELRWGLSKRQVRAIVGTLVRRGFLVVVDPGSRVQPRLVRVLRCGEVVNHLPDHSADHSADHWNGVDTGAFEEDRTTERTTDRTTERTEEDRLHTTDHRLQTSPEREIVGQADHRPAAAGQHAPTAPTQGAPTSQEPKKPDLVAEVWSEIEAVRLAHLPGRTKALNRQRRDNLSSRMKELRKAGYNRADLLAAVAWVCTSANIRAEGARSTGDPVGTLLRARHCLDYVELAREGATSPPRPAQDRPSAPQSVNGYPSAAAVMPHVQRLIASAPRRPDSLHADPVVSEALLSACNALGGWQALGRLDSYATGRTFAAAGPFAAAYLAALQAAHDRSPA